MLIILKSTEDYINQDKGCKDPGKNNLFRLSCGTPNYFSRDP